MRTVLITGASRGIGLGLARELLRSANTRVVATARHPESARELADLLKEYGADGALPLDVTSDESIQQLATELKTRNISVDILINNAGISNANHPTDPPQDVVRAELLHILNTNVGGTLATTQHLNMLRPGAAVVNISSLLGSISLCSADNKATSYKCSKAALNMLTKCFAAEYPETIFVSVHPGWVQTDMGNSQGRRAPLTVEESASGIVRLISGLTLDQSGKFLNWKGEEIPF